VAAGIIRVIGCAGVLGAFPAIVGQRMRAAWAFKGFGVHDIEVAPGSGGWACDWWNRVAGWGLRMPTSMPLAHREESTRRLRVPIIRR
jgi:hypothetical protein